MLLAVLSATAVLARQAGPTDAERIAVAGRSLAEEKAIASLPAAGSIKFKIRKSGRTFDLPYGPSRAALLKLPARNAPYAIAVSSFYFRHHGFGRTDFVFAPVVSLLDGELAVTRTVPATAFTLVGSGVWKGPRLRTTIAFDESQLGERYLLIYTHAAGVGEHTTREPASPVAPLYTPAGAGQAVGELFIHAEKSAEGSLEVETQSTISHGQLGSDNGATVKMGHVHLNVRDLEASTAFYVGLGGTAARVGTMEVVRFPGALFILQKAEPAGDMEGSSVNHIGFVVKDGASLMARLKAQGLRLASNGMDWRGGYVYSPDGVKIEIIDRPALTIPIQFEQVHFFVADPGPGGGPAWSELQAWYTTMFGAIVRRATLSPPTPGNLASAPMSVSELAGTMLRFSKVDAPTAPTQGRAMDHIGFEVTQLESFCKQLAAKGVRFDASYTYRKDLGIGLASLTDPKGTHIELTEGLDVSKP